MNDITTFNELYKYLQNNDIDIIEWLNEEKWKGKDKQESLLRLFSGLGLIEKLDKYSVCKGNFNLKQIEKYESYRDIFYNSNGKLKCLNDKGDSSDLTCMSKENENHLLITTSKSLKKEQVGGLDIEKLTFYSTQYTGYLISLCICIKDEGEFHNMKNRSEITSGLLKEYIDKQDSIIIDWNDLNQAYHVFKNKFEYINFEKLIECKQEVLKLKLHQKLSVMKTARMKREGKKTILWGHIQRSGKSYIMAGTIIEDSKDKEKCNYLVLSPAPNETIEQQRKVFECLEFKDFNVVILNGDNKNPEIKSKNIILCSKQFLQTKINDIKQINWMKKMKFDMRFCDESHYGGTTELAQRILNYYSKNSFTVQITATYSKPINNYNIPKENWILWDMEDIKFCKNIREDKEKLIQKHGDEFKICNEYTEDSIINEYSRYPELVLLTHKINDETVKEIISKTINNNNGWSTDGCFVLKNTVKESSKVLSEEFQNEKQTLNLFYKIFGKYDKYGIADDNYPDEDVFMKRIEKICKNPEVNSRIIGEGDFEEEPMILMCFLPQQNISKISNAVIKLLKKYKVIPDYDIIAINSDITSNPKEKIEDARKRARIEFKKGVLVLSGKQCNLGVSIHNCDIVILLNNTKSFDMIYQMMFRSMTEGKGKRCGFVIDLNIHRVIEKTIVNYSSIIKPHSHPKESIKYILQERLIILNPDDWNYCYGKTPETLNYLTENIYQLFSSNIQASLKNYIKQIELKQVSLTNKEQTFLNNNINGIIETKNKQKIKDEEDEEEKIKKGIEKEKIKGESGNESENDSDESDNTITKVNFMKILTTIIPLICILTVKNDETLFLKMIESLKVDDYLLNIFILQLRQWWGNKINICFIDKIINIYIKYMENDKDINQTIRIIKELFMKQKNSPHSLSKLIDTYLIPLESEKKILAEVSTPYKLRQEMLDKIPEDFWYGYIIFDTGEFVLPKVFEPCSGKGGFLLDIIDRLMDGLDYRIPDEKERYKTIVEQCLYFSDISERNVFICKLLIDPNEQYELNYNVGNTLELDIDKKWRVKGFDAVVGNPPYNMSGKTSTGNTIWQEFTKTSLNNWLLKEGYLNFIHPPGWRKPCYQKSQLKGIFELLCCKNQMIYLSIHNIEDGKKIFNCGTRFDWYLVKKIDLQRCNHKLETIINDENSKICKINLKKINWLPNSNIEKILNILSTDLKNCNPVENLQVLMNSSYHAIRDYVNNEKSEIYKYPLIHSTPKSGVRYKYSKINNKGHFGVSKVIFGESGINNTVIDMDGKYGMTQGAIGILVNNKIEAENISKALLSKNFDNLIKSCIIGNFRIEWRLFTYFKKDFWKQFI